MRRFLEWFIRFEETKWFNLLMVLFVGLYIGAFHPRIASVAVTGLGLFFFILIWFSNFGPWLLKYGFKNSLPPQGQDKEMKV